MSDKLFCCAALARVSHFSVHSASLANLYSWVMHEATNNAIVPRISSETLQYCPFLVYQPSCIHEVGYAGNTLNEQDAEDSHPCQLYHHLEAADPGHILYKQHQSLLSGFCICSTSVTLAEPSINNACNTAPSHVALRSPLFSVWVLCLRLSI